MKELFWQYVIKLYQDVPTEVYEGLLSIFCFGTVGLVAFLGWKKGWKKVAELLFFEYVYQRHADDFAHHELEGLHRADDDFDDTVGLFFRHALHHLSTKEDDEHVDQHRQSNAEGKLHFGEGLLFVAFVVHPHDLQVDIGLHRADNLWVDRGVTILFDEGFLRI